MTSRSHRKVSLAAAAGVLIACVSVTGCATGTGGSSEPSTTVRVGTYAGNTLLDLTTYVAMEEGFLADRLAEVGADVEIVEFGNGPDLIAGMLGGSADVGILPGNALAAVNAQAGGSALRLLTNSFEGTGLVFVGAEQYEGEDLDAYDGRTWGYSKEGSATQVLAQFVADDALSGWSGQTGLALGPTSTAVPALARGQADIIVTDPAGAAVALGQGVGYVVYNPAESDEFFPYNRACNGVAASGTFVDQHPEIARAILESQSDAIALLKEQADAASVLALTPAAFQEANADTFEVAWELYLPSLANTDGTLSDACVDDTVAYAQYQGVEGVDLDAFAPLG